jgi:invasion protein IalB
MKHSAFRWAIGSVFAVTVIAGAYFLFFAHAPPPPSASVNAVRSASEVDPGFIGIMNYGHWRLICVPARNAKAAAGDNDCRVNQEVAPPGLPDQVLLAANLSVSAGHNPSVMLRLPPTAHDGDAILLRFSGTTLKASVHGCSQSECVATAELGDDDWSALIAAKGLQVILPTRIGQRALVDVSAEGLAQAVAAMNKAEGITAD